jgi:hypothetical protein
VNPEQPPVRASRAHQDAAEWTVGGDGLISVIRGVPRVAYMNPKHEDPEAAQVTGYAIARRLFMPRAERGTPLAAAPQPFEFTTGADLAAKLRPACQSWDEWSQRLALARRGGKPDGHRLVDIFLINQHVIGRATAKILQLVLADQQRVKRAWGAEGVYPDRLLFRDGRPIIGVTAVRDPWEWTITLDGPSLEASDPWGDAPSPADPFAAVVATFDPFADEREPQ